MDMCEEYIMLGSYSGKRFLDEVAELQAFVHLVAVLLHLLLLQLRLVVVLALDRLPLLHLELAQLLANLHST